MAFRDDREALRARAEALESEIAEVREEFERASEALARQQEQDEEDEEEIASLRDEVTSLRKKLGVEESRREKSARRDERKERQKKRQAKRSRRAPRVRWLTWFTANEGATRLLVVGLAMFGGLAYFTIQGQLEKNQSGPTSDVNLAPPAAPTPTAPTAALAKVIFFGAEVMSVEGLALELGDGCVVEAELRYGPSVGTVRVICDRLIYDSTTQGGMEVRMSDSRVLERADATGRLYELSYGDTGTRTGVRPQLRVDSREARVDVWRDGADPFRLELRIDDLSVSQAGPRFGSAPTAAAMGHGFRMRAIVTAREGAGPSVSGDECSVYVRPYASEGRLNCRVLVSCGADVIYGAHNTGYNLCTLEDQTFDQVNDEGTTANDSDPMLRLDRSARTMVLADYGVSGRWQIDFRLEADPRCELGGHWSGVMTGVGAVSEAIDLSVGEQAVLTREFADSTAEVLASADDEEHVVVDCVRGTATLVGLDGSRWEGGFGPGFATLLGSVRGAAPRSFWLRRD